MNTNIFTTSYKSDKARQIIKLVLAFVVSMHPRIRILELGTQQGGSTCFFIDTLRHLKPKDSIRITTVDTFESTYKQPPFSSTHANKQKAVENILTMFSNVAVKSQDVDSNTVSILTDNNLVKIVTSSAAEFVSREDNGVYYDLIHIDICNHADNVKPIFDALQYRSEQGYGYLPSVILLEGGKRNHWQTEHGFESFLPILESNTWVKDNFDINVIDVDDTNSITILVH